MSIDWTEKYRPKTLKEVVGNNKALDELEKWAESWEKGFPKNKAVILVGDAGVGKTSSAHALANDFGWGVIELNASDARNAENIKRIAGRGAVYETFTEFGEYIKSRDGGRKLIILDEADNLYERINAGEELERDVSDKGGLTAIIDTIKKTHQPIVLIVNDYYALTKRSSTIRELCKVIKFNKVNKNVVKSALKRICENEGIEISLDALDTLAVHSQGDLRSAINDLQSLADGRKRITKEDVEVLGYRDVNTTIFIVLKEIFKKSSVERARNAVTNLDESPEHIILWIEENLPLEYKNPADLCKSFSVLAKADIFLGRIKRRQFYGLWSYASDLMTAGVSLAKEKPYYGFTKYQFPAWLLKMSRSRSIRSTREHITLKIGGYCHTSRDVTRHDILPYFSYIFNHDRGFAIANTIRFKFEADEIAYLMNEKIDSHLVKHLLEDAEKVTEVKEVAFLDAYGNDDEKKDQKSLFEF